MALGLDMMMKSFGLNPDEIKQSVGNMSRFMADIAEGVKRIEAQNAEILERLSSLENKGAQNVE